MSTESRTKKNLHKSLFAIASIAAVLIAVLFHFIITSYYPRASRLFAIAVQAGATADYSSNPAPILNQPIGIGIILDVINDRLQTPIPANFHIEQTIEAYFTQDIPTITPLPTNTLGPGTILPESTSTVTSTVTVAATILNTETATTTNTPTLSPTPIIVIPTNTVTYTPKPPKSTKTPIPPTNTPLPTNTSTNTPLPTNTPTNTPLPTNTPTNTPLPTSTPVSVTMHVANMTRSSVLLANNKWIAIVSITIHDEYHNVASDVTIVGSWTEPGAGPGSARTSCLTNANGKCSVNTLGVNKNVPSTTFTINVAGVNHATSSYLRSANHDSDGCETATCDSITVTNPVAAAAKQDASITPKERSRSIPKRPWRPFIFPPLIYSVYFIWYSVGRKR